MDFGVCLQPLKVIFSTTENIRSAGTYVFRKETIFPTNSVRSYKREYI